MEETCTKVVSRVKSKQPEIWTEYMEDNEWGILY